MTPQHRNNFLLYIHKQETDSLDLITIAKGFVSHTLAVIFNLGMSITVFFAYIDLIHVCKKKNLSDLVQNIIFETNLFLGSGAC